MTTRNAILFSLFMFCIFGIWAPKLQGSLAPYYELQTVWFGEPPTPEWVFIQNTDGVNSWAGGDPGALEGVAINDNLDSAGVGVPPGGFSGSQGAVVVYNVSGEAGNGALCALSSAFPSSQGGPGGSGLPTDLGEAILHVDIAFEVPGHSEITSLPNALNFWVKQVDGDAFELEAADSLDLTTNGWQTYTFVLSELPLEPGSSGVFGDSGATLASVEFEDPASPGGLETIIYYVDNFRIESYGETLFFEDFEPLTSTIVDIDITPDTLNLKSKGLFTAFVELPEGYDEEDVDIGTVECEGAPAVKAMMADDNRLIVKFNSEDLVGVSAGDDVELIVTGQLLDGTIFVGSDTIRVIDKGGKTK